ncbi:MAG: glycosyl transferase [bacterium]|nr:MAG: glycosyl transferase [bacterium]
MSDFWQHGPITTIHRFPGLKAADLEKVVQKHATGRPAVLLVPALASEMAGAAWPVLLKQIRGALFLDELILALGRATPEDLVRAKSDLDGLPMKTTVVWPESVNLHAVLEKVRPSLDVGPPGKGRDVWIALGFILGQGHPHAIALNDADITTFTREIPLRLLAPLLHPALSYDFTKGYYARVSGSYMAGRATRLLVAPLVAILLEKNGNPPFRIIGAMRYALAGEFAMTADLAAKIPIPRDWGLEVGILSAVARAVPFERICQADLCDNYEHKHQELHPEDATKGLNRMAVEVTAALLREVGRIPDNLVTAYREQAVTMIPKYRADALASGLDYDEAKEYEAVETFAGAIEKALSYGADDIPPPLPPWNEVENIAPGLREAIVEAVEKDNA